MTGDTTDTHTQIIRPSLRTPWRAYAQSALAIAASTGFLIGSVTAIVQEHRHDARFSVALAQLHGQLQVVGFLGVFTLGVFFHFFPRLRGTAPPSAQLLQFALGGLLVGLGLRVIGTLLVLLVPTAWLQWLGQQMLRLAGVTLFAGGGAATLGCGLQLRMHSVGQKTSLRVFTATVVLAFGALLCGLGLIARGLWQVDDHGIMPVQLDTAATILLLYSFMVPIALVMSARVFPLFFQLQRPRERWLALAVAFLFIGTICRVVRLFVMGLWLVAGQLLLVIGMLMGVFALRIFEPRRPLPRTGRVWYRDPLHWLMLWAEGWFVAASITLAWNGIWHQREADIFEWHLVGLGYLTTLVFAVGSHLLPGFSGVRLRSSRVSWAVTVCSPCVVVLRILPLLPGMPGDSFPIHRLVAIAGLLGLSCSVLFGWNTGLFMGMVRRSPRSLEAPPG